MAIVPDNKDWTWVVRERCPECGFDAPTVPAEHVAPQLRDTATQWRLVLGRPDAARRPTPDRWSPLEYACHVRDAAEIYLGRLDRMLTEDDPMYQNWDQDKTAVERRYDEQDPAPVPDQVDAAVFALADRFDEISGPQWQRPGRRSDGATFTIETFARYFLHDVVHHLWDVAGDGSHKA